MYEQRAEAALHRTAAGTEPDFAGFINANPAGAGAGATFKA